MDPVVGGEGSHVVLEVENWPGGQEIQVLASLNLN